MKPRWHKKLSSSREIPRLVLRRKKMGFTYNGYAVMPDSNGPGYIIRDARDIGALIVASAPTAQASAT